MTYIKQHLSWTHRPGRELVRLAWPIAVTMISYSTMTLVDTAFVGRLGPKALAGVGLAGIASFTLLCFPVGTLRSIKVLVSQRIGPSHQSEVARYVIAGIRLAIVFGAAVVLVGQLLALVLPGIADSQEAGGFAQEYLQIRVLGAPLFLVYVALREARYAGGDTRVPMLASLAGNLVNAGLDYYFVIVLQTGVGGVAWASVVGNCVEAGILIASLRLPAWRAKTGYFDAIRSLLRIGVPCGMQFLLEVGSFAALTAIIATMSDMQLAAHQIVLQIVQVSFLPAFAVSEAGSVLAGQAIGMNRPDLVKQVAWRALWLVGIYTGFCTVILATQGGIIVRIFTDDVTLTLTALGVIQVAVVFQIADGANVVARGILRGTGDVRYPAVAGIITAWVCTPPLAWLLGHVCELGALGGWIGLCIQIFIGAGLFWRRVAKGCWLPLAIAERPC